MKRIAHIIIAVAIALTPCFVRAQQYDIIRQGVCWTDTSGIDSSLTRMVYVSIAGAGPISVRYVNASGNEVDVSAGGSFEMGYCGCCGPAIDSSTVSGDSVFIWSGGESFFSGAEVPVNNFGRVLFVTVSGNDTTAVVGSLLRTWASPWTAISEALPGDLIYIYPGTYTTTGTPNMWKDGVTMYFAPNASIHQRPAPTTGTVGNALFYCSNSGSMEIYGGNFSANGELYSDNVAVIDTANVNISFYGTQTLTIIAAAYGARNCAIYASASENMPMVYFSSLGGNTADSIVDISAYIEGQMLTYFHPVFLFSSVNSKMQRIRGSAEVKNMDIKQLGTGLGNNDRGLLSVTSSGSPMNDISINISIEKSTIDNRISGNRIMLYGMNNLVAHTNFRYNLHCSQCELIGNNQVSVIGSNVKRMTGVKGVISGNYYFSGGAVLIGGGGGGFNSQTDLHFTGTYRSDRELCDTINTIIPYNFSGYYYTAAAKPVFAWNTLTANTYINYNGAVLKNAGGDKLLIPSASYNNGYERYIATNEAMYNSRIQATETYRLEQDADSIRITYLSGPLVAATNTGALYSAATDTMFNNVANANLTADESYTTDWQDHSITFDFSGAPLDSMVYRFPSPDGKLQGLYVSDGEGNMSFIVNKIQSTDFDNMLDHNNAGIITLGNVNDSTIIHGDMIFIESPNMPQNDTLQNAYTKGAGNKVSLTKIPYSGITTATTDGSGDITVTLGITMPDNTYAVTATPQSSTFQVCNVVSKTATSFVLRFYTAVGVPITSTEVTANWIVRDN